MQVTDAKFTSYTRGKLIGFAEIVLDDTIKITSITVFDNDGKLSYSMPRNKKKEGDWYDQIFILKSDLKDKIQDALEKVADFASNNQEAFGDSGNDDDSDLPF
jgi:DNA-binding cell septation regulator SpoVG